MIVAIIVFAVLGVLSIFGPTLLKNILELMVLIANHATIVCVVGIIVLMLTSLLHQVAFSKSFYTKYNRNFVKILRKILGIILFVEYCILVLVILTIAFSGTISNCSAYWNQFLKDQEEFFVILNNVGIAMEVFSGGMLVSIIFGDKKNNNSSK